jgi:hypothetical protein
MTLNKKKKPFNKLVGSVLNDKMKMKLQHAFWIYLAYNFIVRGPNEFKMVEPKIKCRFIPITFDNCYRVEDFRKEDRVSQFKEKLARKEIGRFAEHNGKMIGSIWATINKTEVASVAQMFKTINYNEGAVTDNIVSENFRGMRVGPFMESSMFALLLREYGLSKIIADVSIQNHASLRMLERMGLRKAYLMFYFSAFGKPVFQIPLKKYA